MKPLETGRACGGLCTAANAVTAVRIVLLPVLLCLPLRTLPFYICYALCGLSDMLDGYVARRTGSAGKAGAILDSAADALLLAVMLIRFLALLTLPVGIWAWMGGIAALRVAALAVGAVRFRAYVSLHTWSGKAAGLMLFLFPFLYGAVSAAAAAAVLCAVATVAAAEELLLQAVCAHADRDIKSIVCLVRGKAIGGGSGT